MLPNIALRHRHCKAGRSNRVQQGITPGESAQKEKLCIVVVRVRAFTLFVLVKRHDLEATLSSIIQLHSTFVSSFFVMNSSTASGFYDDSWYLIDGGCWSADGTLAGFISFWLEGGL